MISGCHGQQPWQAGAIQEAGASWNFKTEVDVDK